MTPAEIALLDKVATATGTSASAYIRNATKKQLLEDLLNISGHHSTFASSAMSEEASGKLKDLMMDLDYCDSLREQAKIINEHRKQKQEEESNG